MHVGCVENRVAAVSPLTRPEYDAVIVGIAEPYVTLGLEAVTVTGFCVTVTVPSTYVNW